jgi:hypothetical protein
VTLGYSLRADPHTRDVWSRLLLRKDRSRVKDMSEASVFRLDKVQRARLARGADLDGGKEAIARQKRPEGKGRVSWIDSLSSFLSY